MNSYASIQDGVCINAVVCDDPAFAEQMNWIPLPDGYGIGDRYNGEMWSKVPPPPPNLPQLRADKKTTIGAACTAAIYAGVEVSGNRYSLTEHDQTEIMVQLQTIKEDAAAVPYHADGELCRMYPAAEFIGIAKAATEYVFYHRTYCNHVNAWIKRADYDELAAIYYGAELPPDLAASMAAILAAAGGST